MLRQLFLLVGLYSTIGSGCTKKGIDCMLFKNKTIEMERVHFSTTKLTANVQLFSIYSLI